MFLKFIYILLALWQVSCRPTHDLLPDIGGFDKKLSTNAVNQCLEENPSATKYDCEIKNCFASPLTLIALQELLINATEVLDELNVNYWVEGGTLIGAERFSAHLPWDDDVDLGALLSEFDKEKRELFAKKIYERGFEIKPLIGIPVVDKLVGRKGLLQVAYRKSRFERLVLSALPTINHADLENLWLRYERAMSFLPHLDIFLFEEVSPGRYSYEAKHFRKNLKKEKSLPLGALIGPKKIDILGREFKVIQDTKEYGEVVYNTSDLLNDFYISREHSEGCEKLRFKDIRKHPEILDYLIGYLEFVYSLPAAQAMTLHYDSAKVRQRFGLILK